MRTRKSFVGALLLLVISFRTHAFVHPGIPLTATDLNSIKTNLTSQPWASGYSQLVSSGYASTNYTMQGPFGYVSRNEGGTGVNINLSQWENDMQAIYYLSLMWYFTSNSAYAQKSHDILMAWANTLTNFGGYEGAFELGGTAQRYLTGADILRGTWPGWTTSDTTNLQCFFTNVYWPPLSVPKTLMSANQGGFQQMGAVAIAVFCDDTNRLNQSITSLVNDGDTGFRDTLANGEVGDTQRDQGHSYNMVWELAWPAEVLWKQGIDIFPLFDNRILAMSEYYCRYNVPGPPPPFVQLTAPFTSYMTTNIGGAPRSSGQNRLVFNIVHGAYVVRKGISAPWTDQYLNDLNESADSFMYRKVVDVSTATPAAMPTFPASASLTTGLTSANLNGTTPAGSTTYNSATKTWTLSSGYGGQDPWYSSGNDTVRFAYKQVTGDFTMIAKVMSVANVGSVSAKGGLMMRDSLGTATNRVWVGMIAGGNYERAFIGWTDLAYGANNAQMSVPTTGFPYWVKMERIGQRVHTFTSPNGGDWSPASVADLPTMPSTMDVGLFGTSLVNGTASTATFTDVRITGGDGLEAAKIPPAPFAIYAAPGDAQVPLRWNEAFNATGYKVMRSLTNGSGYTTIATVTNTMFADANVTNGITYYYLVTATNSVGQSTNSPGDSATPQLTMVNVAVGGSALASADNASGGQGAAQAFDINPGSKWFNNSAGTNGWLQYDLTPFIRQTVRRYAITSAGDTPGRDPLSWQFQASNDGLIWTTLDTQTNQVFPYRQQTITYPIGNTNAYRFYRLNISANNGDPSGLQLSELALLAISGTGTNLASSTIVWSGAVNANWDTSTANWLSNGVAVTFQNGSSVWFDDTASGSTVINVATTVSPSAMTLNNSTKNYTFSGSAIAGAAAVQKISAGTVTLNSSNGYSGGTTLVSGTLLAPNANALGTGLIILAGATWLFTNSVTITNNIVVQSNTTTAINESTYAVNMVLSGNLSGNGAISASASANFGGAQLSGNNSGYSGTLTVNNSGSQRFRFLAATAGSSNAVWVLNNNTSDGQSANFGNGTLYFGALSGYGQFRQDTAGTTTLEIGALNQDSTFSGIIYQSGSGSIFAVNKVGTGTLTLSGADSYAGATVVKQGRLLVTQAFTGNGGFSVSNNATLGLANNFSSSAAALGALTLASGSALEFQNVSNLTAALAAASTVTVNSNCTVLVTGTNYLSAGNTYPLLNYSSTFNGFTNLQLQMPYGWRGTLTNVSKQVSIANVAVVSTVPPQMSVTYTDSQLQLSWPQANTGWRLQVQTNSTSTGLGTNWIDAADVSSTNQLMLPTSAATGNVFYRLIYP